MSSDPPFDSARHIRYWQRCFRSLLPHHYTSNDSTRLTLGFFILAALDLLSSSSDSRTPLTTLDERTRIRSFILSLQHPHGGFCGSPHHVLPRKYTTHFDWNAEEQVPLDSANANLAATAFALLSLGIVADGGGSAAFEGVNRIATLRWLKKLHREDGSFGELINEHGYVGGGRDMRYCYFAAMVRWALGGGVQASSAVAEDFDVDALVAYIRNAQTFDGGMGESSTHESHSGYSFCALAALSLLDLANPDASGPKDHYLRAGIPSIPNLVHYLASRQFTYLDPTTDGEENDDDDDDDDDDGGPETANHPLPDLSSLALSSNKATDPMMIIGFNGRPNKVADTCYAWWVSGALTLIGEGNVIDRAPARKFMIEKTQHLIGGFAKHPGGPPDIYHAYMGLAALGTLAVTSSETGEEPGLGKFDPILCVGVGVRKRIEKAKEILLKSSLQTDREDVDDTWDYYSEISDEEEVAGREERRKMIDEIMEGVRGEQQKGRAERGLSV